MYPLLNPRPQRDASKEVVLFIVRVLALMVVKVVAVILAMVHVRELVMLLANGGAAMAVIEEVPTNGCKGLCINGYCGLCVNTKAFISSTIHS